MHDPRFGPGVADQQLRAVGPRPDDTPTNLQEPPAATDPPPPCGPLNTGGLLRARFASGSAPAAAMATGAPVMHRQARAREWARARARPTSRAPTRTSRNQDVRRYGAPTTWNTLRAQGRPWSPRPRQGDATPTAHHGPLGAPPWGCPALRKTSGSKIMLRSRRWPPMEAEEVLNQIVGFRLCCAPRKATCIVVHNQIERSGRRAPGSEVLTLLGRQRESGMI